MEWIPPRGAAAAGKRRGPRCFGVPLVCSVPAPDRVQVNARLLRPGMSLAGPFAPGNTTGARLFTVKTPKAVLRLVINIRLPAALARCSSRQIYRWRLRQPLAP